MSYSPRWLQAYLHPGEEVRHLVYHSWVSLTKPVLGCTGLAILPWVVVTAAPDIADWLQAHPLYWLGTVLVGSLYYAGLLLFLLLRYVDYHLDFWIITTERLITVEQEALFSQSISELEITAIQDITSEISGFLNTILNFGDVRVRTASERSAITMDQVAHPHGVRRDLFKLLEFKRLQPVVPDPSPIPGSNSTQPG